MTVLTDGGCQMSTTMKDLGIDRLNVREQLALVEEILDNLPEQVDLADVPPWHLPELARRRARAGVWAGVYVRFVNTARTARGAGFCGFPPPRFRFRFRLERLGRHRRDARSGPASNRDPARRPHPVHDLAQRFSLGAGPHPLR